MSNIEFISRDALNYYHFVGKPYPEINISGSSSRVFFSLFSQKKAYVILKPDSVDLAMLGDIDSIKLDLYRKGVMYFLKITFSSMQSSAEISSTLPINARAEGDSAPQYPDESELLQFELHFIDFLRSEKLAKVVQFYITQPEFQSELVRAYQNQRDAEYSDEVAQVDLKAFYLTPVTQLSQYLVASGEVSITKQAPGASEPKLVAESY